MKTELKADDVIAYVRHLIAQGDTDLQLIDQILAKPWKWSDEINQWLVTQPSFWDPVFGKPESHS